MSLKYDWRFVISIQMNISLQSIESFLSGTFASFHHIKSSSFAEDFSFLIKYPVLELDIC